MKLIIAEKPSLARNIVSSIGNMKQKQNYYEGSGYIVTWAFGHLFSLCDIDDYSPNPDGTKRWTTENLPCFPDNFKFRLRQDQTKKTDPGVERQFTVIKSLCEREDVDTVINAGDSDREGEIIIRLCVINTNALGLGKKFKRLWLPDQTPETIRNALQDMKDENEYDNLANEGFARTYIDWLYGVNFTRFATLKCGTLLRVGRVIIPIVKAIYDRDMAIRNFKSEKYYSIASKTEHNGEKIELSSKNKYSANELEKAKSDAGKYNSAQTIVISRKSKKDKLAPGKLFSLSKLQNLLGKKFKMPMEKSLAIVQKLYEEGYVTYPRTNSEYLATAEQDKIRKIISGVKKLGYPIDFRFSKTIFDDSKIESHSALTPTYKIPEKSKLSEEEMQVYSTIMRRFVAVFCSNECLVEKSEIKIKTGQYEEFTLKGTIIIEPGWTKFDDNNQKDKILPKLEKGDIIQTNFEPVEKETTPPKHYTIETLNNYLKNPFKEDKQSSGDVAENDEEDYKAIFEGLELGTEATRTGIIENARKSNYIKLNKDTYTILPDGEYLIESLKRMNITMDKYKTSEMGRALKAVYRGDMTVDESVRLAIGQISSVFTNTTASTPENDTDDGFFGDYIGKCPICQSDVVKGRYGYGCKGYKEGCKFRINSFLCGRIISKANAKLLLETGLSSKIEGFVSKAGKQFDAKLKLENNKITFVFDSDNTGAGKPNSPTGFTNYIRPSSEDLAFLESITPEFNN